jgi:hypothetical protein
VKPWPQLGPVAAISNIVTHFQLGALGLPLYCR